MGFLDQLLTGITGKQKVSQQSGKNVQGGKGSELYEHVSKMITQAGGIDGLIRQFQQKGLGDMIAGWIGTGANPSISPEQITQALGQDRIRSIASTMGLTEEQVSQSIAKLLPVIVDKLTPGGKVMENQAPDEIEKALRALKSKFLGS
jgi:uncharacterized protein YidB (DUF937 family)